MNKVVKKRKRTGVILKEGGFKRAFYSMPHNQLEQIRDEISQKCGWGIDTFRKSLTGRRACRFLEVKEIENYFADKGFDAWTGEPITK